MIRRFLVFIGILALIPLLFGVVVGFGIGSDGTGWVTTTARAVAVVFLTFIAVVVASFVFVRSWRPVQRLIDAAGRVADGDYSTRVQVARSGSLRSVTTSFNSMAAQLEAAQDQRRQLLADVGHELRTPLTVLRCEIEAMVDGIHPADPAHLLPLLDDVAVMERLLDDLRTLSQAEAGALALHREPLDVSELAAEVADSLRREAEHHNIAIGVSGPDRMPLQLLDPVRIREVLLNLMVNAIRAMPDGGTLAVEVMPAPGVIEISVSDTGHGIPAEAQEWVFERFHKGTDSRGTGLGLTISRDLVAAHGGTLELEESSPAGTTMRITLPDQPV